MRSRGPSLAAVATAVAAALASAAPAAALPLETPTVRATGLSTPWAVAVAPDGRVFVTERSARATNINATPAPRIRLITPSGIQGAPVYEETEPGVTARKFLGLALHPDFATNHLAYLYETYTRAGETHSRIVRLVDDGTAFSADGKVLIDGIDSDLNHDGGRIAFGPDGKLYATTGDIHDPARPRDVQNLNGKILRLEAPGTAADGTAPADNPFVAQGGNARFVWSLGHRHPQGLAWDAQGRLWETEHGPSGEAHAPAGATNGRDELNLIVKGGDYGWPTVAGDQTLAGTIPPKVHSGPAPAWAPAGLAFGADGLLYAPMLNGTGLRVFGTDASAAVTSNTELYDGTYGRMRAATADGSFLWLTTDDGRVLRVRIAADPGGGGGLPGTPGTPATPGTPTATTPVPAPAGPTTTPPAITPTPAAPEIGRTVLAERLTTRGTSALERLGLRGLLRRGAFTVKVGGLGTRRAVVRLQAGRTTVARGTAQPDSRRTVAVRVKLTQQGRRLLRRHSAITLTLRTDVLASGARRGAVQRTTIRLRR